MEPDVQPVYAHSGLYVQAGSQARFLSATEVTDIRMVLFGPLDGVSPISGLDTEESPSHA